MFQLQVTIIRQIYQYMDMICHVHILKCLPDYCHLLSKHVTDFILLNIFVVLTERSLWLYYNTTGRSYQDIKMHPLPLWI